MLALKTKMFQKLLYKGNKFLCKEYGVFKLFFFLLFLCLLVDEIYVCVVEKPTLTMIVKEELTKEDFPSITLCPGPSIDHDEMISRGFVDIWTYKSGISYTNSWNDINFIGWGGNNGSETIQEVSSAISVLKSVSDCPETNISALWYARNESNPEEMPYQFLNFTLEEALFPEHFCCKVQFPKAAQTKAIHGLEIAFFEKNKRYNNFRVMLTDQMSSSVFEQINSYPLGDAMFTSEYEGYTHYKVKIKQESHLETDPNYHCIDYKAPGEYDSCLRNEFIKESFDLIGCAPPWLTKNETLWCKENELISEKIYTSDGLYRWTTFVTDVSFGLKKHSCSVPCTRSKFFSTYGGYRDTVFGQKGLLIMFDRVVEKTVSEFQRSPKTMLTRFGGLIGLGKNLLWIVILSDSSIGFFTNNKIIRYKRK